jgi:hypothetical protein
LKKSEENKGAVKQPEESKPKVIIPEQEEKKDSHVYVKAPAIAKS